MSFQIFDVILQNFPILSLLTEIVVKKQDLQKLVLKSGEKIMENVCGSDQL